MAKKHDDSPVAATRSEPTLEGTSPSVAEQRVVEMERHSPDVAYEEVRKSLVYRLSEAMFASLLASYIIGFAGFVASEWLSWRTSTTTITASALAEPLLAIGNLLAVSVTYAFLTTAIYLNYNTTLLTMASYELKNARRDFPFAVSQGFLFGIAMLCPRLLLLTVTLIILVSYWIRRTEFTAFLDMCLVPHSIIIFDNNARIAKAQKQRLYKKIQVLTKTNGFRDWRLPTAFETFLTISGCLGGFIIAASGVAHLLEAIPPNLTSPLLYANGLINLAVVFVLSYSSFKTIESAGDFMAEHRIDKNSLRSRYDNLTADIKKLSLKDLED